MLSYKIRYKLSHLRGEREPLSNEVRKERKRIRRGIAVFLLVLYLLSPFFAVARLQIQAAVQGGPSPLGHILYYRQIDSGFAVEIVGEKLYMGEGRRNAYPYFVVRNGVFWRAVQMNENTKLLFQETNNRTEFFVSDSFVERLGRYTILCIGSRYLENRGIPGESLHDSEGTSPLLISNESFHKSADWGHWGALSKDDYSSNSRTRDMSDYGWVFIVKDMPETYQLYCGEQKITAAEINNRLIQDKMT